MRSGLRYNYNREEAHGIKLASSPVSSNDDSLFTLTDQICSGDPVIKRFITPCHARDLTSRYSTYYVLVRYGVRVRVALKSLENTSLYSIRPICNILSIITIYDTSPTRVKPRHVMTEGDTDWGD